MNRMVLLCMAALIGLSACGIKRPLMRPKDIPAYEEKRARKMERLAPRPAAPATVPAPDTSQPGGQSLQDLMTPMPSVEQ